MLEVRGELWCNTSSLPIRLRIGSFWSSSFKHLLIYKYAQKSRCIAYLYAFALPWLLSLWFARSVCAADVKRGGNWIFSSMVLACITPLCMRLAVHSQLIQLYNISKRFSSVLGPVTCLHMLWRSGWPILSFSINVAVTGYGQVTNELAFSEIWISIHYTCATSPNERPDCPLLRIWNA